MMNFSSIFLIISINLLLNFSVFSQNLVPNPSFENYTTCPGTVGDFVGFCNQWTEPGTGTTDYFNTCGGGAFSPVQSPTNFMGYQQAYSGTAYVGINVFYPGTSTVNSYREYIQVQLTSPLVAGVDYDFSMMVSRGNKTKGYLDNLGVHFSNTAISVSNGNQLTNNQQGSYIPQLVNTGGNFIIDTANWQPVTGTYTASGGEEFIVIGNFDNDANSNYTLDNSTVNYAGYVLIDEVSLVQAQCSVSAGPDQTICLGSSITLTGSGATNYTWDNGVVDGVAFIPPLGTTTYTVTGTDGAGCTGTDEVEITVVDVTVDAGADQIVCEGDQITLTGSGATSYTWDNGVTDGVAFTPPLGTTSYIVQGTDVNGCVNTDTVSITVVGLEINAGEDQQVCEGTEVVLSGSGGSNYSWSNGIVDGESFIPQTGTNNYVLSSVYANNCVATDTVIITVEPKPVASFTYSPDQPSNLSPTVYFTNTSTNSTSYLWTLDDDITSSQLHPSYTYGDTGIYEVELIAYSDLGCSDTAQLTIVFINQFLTLYVPNAFSPNGDGINDVFLPIIGGEEPEEYELSIFNRWGELIYSTQNLNDSWDGSMNGTEVQVDTYVWKLRLNRPELSVEVQEFVGHVVLVR